MLVSSQFLVTVNLQGDLTLQMVVAAIGESVGLSIAFDKRGMMEVVGDIDSLKVSAPTGRRKALDHLERLLKPEGLVAVPLSTGWTITSEDRAFALQMRQKIDVAWVSKPLDELVAQMSELHRINVVIDGVTSSAATLFLPDDFGLWKSSTSVLQGFWLTTEVPMRHGMS